MTNDPNPHRDLYRQGPPNLSGGYAGRLASWTRAEIAYARAQERPQHLAHYPEVWEEDFTPAGPWEPRRVAP